jgi:type II secretory pathway component PulC
MPKLEKRQMIILAVMVIAILYGAYELFLTKKKGAPVDLAQKTSDLKTFVTGLTTGIGAEKDATALIFSRAEKEWTQDPFLDSQSQKAWAQTRVAAQATAGISDKKIEFVYSGFLGSGKKSLAVINGVEYKEGESLDTAGFVLRSASPARVVIENRGSGAMLNIPMQD